MASEVEDRSCMHVTGRTRHAHRHAVARVIAHAAVLANSIMLGCAASSPERPDSSPPAQTVVASVRSLGDSGADLAALRQAIGTRRIVLLGENGHGVGQFSGLKVRMIRDLHERLGFDVIAFESGYHDCRAADEQLVAQPVVQSFRNCLAYAFEHAEILPLFEYVSERRRAGHALTITGVDLQTQGATTATRPDYLRRTLTPIDPALANAAAAADSSLIRAAAAGSDTLRQWLRGNGRHALALLDSAGARAAGDPRWTALTAAALIRRLMTRDDAEQRGDSTPATFYGARDEWMARTISWLADSSGPPRRVVVWLHNDHGRLGEWATPAGRVVAAGGLLRARYPRDVFSVGFFMGQGSVANNSRATRPMLPLPSDGIEAMFERAGFPVSFLELATDSNAAVVAWGEAMQPYLRNGLAVDSLRPRREFDALVYVSRVTPPTYRIP